MQSNLQAGMEIGIDALITMTVLRSVPSRIVNAKSIRSRNPGQSFPREAARRVQDRPWTLCTKGLSIKMKNWYYFSHRHLIRRCAILVISKDTRQVFARMVANTHTLHCGRFGHLQNWVRVTVL